MNARPWPGPLLAFALATATACSTASPGPPAGSSRDCPPPVASTLQSFRSVDAVQGVAVDERHVYALSGRHVSRHDRRSGASTLRSRPPSDGTPIVHLDSGVVHAGRLHAAHSDWPAVPTSSSVEIWNPETLEHVGSHDFGTRRGAFTWLDRHAGAWWGTFTDYGREPSTGDARRQGREVVGTRLVEMDERFDIVRAWRFPRALLRRLAPMSNSGGSWGPDGFLYLTGHDRPELYRVTSPASGGELEWIATVRLPDIEGQGIAWDRSVEPDVLYGVSRSRRAIVKMHLSRCGARRRPIER